MRTFVAVFPPPEVTAALEEWLEGVRRPGDGVSWVRAQNLHYTLRFLGELEDNRVAAAVRAAEAAVVGGRPFPLRLGAVGAFPNFRRPRVLWIGAKVGAEELETLARSLDEALRREGFGRADKPFRSHLTVGRVRDPRLAEEAVARLSRGGPEGRFTVREMVVVHSTLNPRGSIYRPVARAALGPESNR